MADGSGLSCTVAHAARALMASVCRGEEPAGGVQRVPPVIYFQVLIARAPGSIGSL